MIVKVANSLLAPFGAKLVSARPQPNVTVSSGTRFLLLADLYREIEGVPGCIVECGVAYGRGIVALSLLSQHHGDNRIIYGFDTFAGYPSVSDRDAPKDIRFLPPKVGGLRVPKSETLRFIRSAGIKDSFIESRIKLIEGDVVETTKAFSGGPIAMLVTEMDMYAGSKAALENLLPHMAKGGIIAPLNYGKAATKFPGGHEAVEEVFGQQTAAFKTHAPSTKRYYVQA